jgi:hypothetical protein
MAEADFADLVSRATWKMSTSETRLTTHEACSRTRADQPFIRSARCRRKASDIEVYLDIYVLEARDRRPITKLSRKAVSPVLVLEQD